MAPGKHTKMINRTPSFICSNAPAIEYSIKTNKFGDQLPIIPKGAKVAHKTVQFQLDIDITVTCGGVPMPGLRIPFRVSGDASHARMLRPTDAKGKAVLRLATRIFGPNVIWPLKPEFGMSIFSATIIEAWYEATFNITNYHCADEDELSGKLVKDKNVGWRKEDFLFGVGGVPMEGSGRGSDDKYIALSSKKKLHWDGPPKTWIINREDAKFEYTSTALGNSSNPLEPYVSIAVDPNILPLTHRVDILGPRALGVRRADDVGDDIKGHHFDHYVGVGNAAVQRWKSQGGGIDAAKVKYLGP